jgi:hypothetical protein
MPEAAASAYRTGETDAREVMVMLMVEAVRFGGPQVLVARHAPDPVAGPGQVVVRSSPAAARRPAL